MISKKMNGAINEQIGHEFGASLQYTAIAAYFAADGLPELAARFSAQSTEERDHALRLVKYVVDAGGQVEIPAVPAPKRGFKSVVEVVRLSLEWEKTVTAQINGLVKLAIKDQDYTTQTFLNWFVNEQLEEVSSMDNLLKVAQRAGDNLLYVEEYVARNKDKEGPGAATEEAG